jgi:hypothetical protein
MIFVRQVKAENIFDSPFLCQAAALRLERRASPHMRFTLFMDPVPYLEGRRTFHKRVAGYSR